MLTDRRHVRTLKVGGPLLAMAAAAVLASGCADQVRVPTVAVTTAVDAPAPAPTEPTASPTPATTAPAAVATGAAQAALLALPVKGRAAKTGYDRAAFGTAWADVDRNGCDTRNDVLAHDLRRSAVLGTCAVVAGTLRDPYTGSKIRFTGGSSVQIDHVVALSDAWQKGAQKLSATQRKAFANDPLNLLAVGGSVNTSKGDGDAATWLPPSKPIRCAYVARQIAVKAKYGLWVTKAEQAAMIRVLSTCPGQGVGRVWAKQGTPKVIKPKLAPRPSNVHYANCTAARAAGAAPVHRGDPGYGSHLDRDNDGVGCE